MFMKTIYTHNGLGHIDDLLSVSILYENGDIVKKIKNGDKLELKEGDIVVDVNPNWIEVPDGVVVLDHHKLGENECSFIKALKYMNLWDDVLYEDETLMNMSSSDVGLTPNSYKYGIIDLAFVKIWWSNIKEELKDSDYEIIKIIKKVIIDYIENTKINIKNISKILSNMKVFDSGFGKVAIFDKEINLGLIAKNLDKNIIYAILPNSQKPETQTNIVALNGKGGNPEIIYKLFFSNIDVVFKHPSGFMIVLDKNIKNIINILNV